MKEYRLLIWMTQLGLSAVLPLAGFVLLGVWLHRQIGWGQWSVWVGLILGLICAVQGFRDSVRAMKRMFRDDKKDPPPIAFNQHD